LIRLVIVLAAVGLAPAVAHAQAAGAPWTLERLVAEGERTHASVIAAEKGLASAQQLLKEAQRAWWPNASVEGVVAPSVDIRCADDKNQPSPFCLTTLNDIHNPVQAFPTGALTRWELRLAFPLYTFGKLDGAKNAAAQGVLTGESRVVAARLDIAVAIKRTYYGIKIARELIEMIRDGRDKLTDAIKQIEKDVEKGKATEADRLRLRVVETVVDARSLEAVKGERLAIAALHTLVPTTSEKLDIDDEPIQPVDLPERPVSFYIDAARQHRPEAQMVRFGEAAARTNVDINRANLFPDILLVGSVFGLWKTTEDDDPASPYMNHPFASYGYGGGLVVRWGLDFHLKIPRLLRARDDYEAARAGGDAAQGWMSLDVVNAYESVREAKDRMAILYRGEKAAHSWLTAIAQNFAIGTAEARDFNDALVAYFEAHGRWLQSIYDFNVAVVSLERAVGTTVTK